MRLVVAALCALATHAQSSLIIDGIESALGGHSGFGLFLSLIEAIPPDDVLNFVTLLSGNLTLAIPDTAPTSVVSQLLNDPPSIIPVLSYHLMRGSVTNTSIATSPEHSIVHTALTDPSMVLLENNGSQVLVLTKESDGFVHILNQPTDVVLTRQDDISILDDTYAWSIINQMLVVPLKMSETLPNHNLNTFLQSVAIAGIQEPLENIPGVTLFVPQDSAFSSAQSILSHLDNTELASVLRGHVMNGTFYSPQLWGGETQVNLADHVLTTTGNKVSLQGGNAANIITSDILLQNGVVHIIDTVLLLDRVKSSATRPPPTSGWTVTFIVLACYSMT